MGLLTLGAPLDWSKAKDLAAYVREHGIQQFLSIYNNLKDRNSENLFWGDEVEYIIVDVGGDHVKLSLRSVEILDQLPPDDPLTGAWRPEYGMFMVEGTPGVPYSAEPRDLLAVEANLKVRRQTVQKLLKPTERLVTLTSFPFLGVGDFTVPPSKPGGDAAESMFVSDDCINSHPRFRTLTRNIRHRKGRKVAINIPLFMDSKTDPQVGTANGNEAAKPGHIYMDCMAFGMGSCCLQVTYQCQDLAESKYLYDHMAPLAPIMLALSAAAPIQRGLLADIDVRWTVISQSVDDRTNEELGKEPLKNDRFQIPKSRYDGISCYISEDGQNYNDVDLVYDKAIYQSLVDSGAGISDALARHIAHLFIRDPLVIYQERLELDDANDADHFENIQSTNWQTVRWKPPPPNTPIGWRVEFRPLEAQLTDFENAAFAVFTVLLTRTITSFNLNILTPVSKMDENMNRAHNRDAINKEKFHFRTNIHHCDDDGPPCDNSYEEFTINEIMNGKGDDFVGLVPLVERYLETMEIDVQTKCVVERYLHFISRRASGELLSAASWMRKFVTEHSDYKQDSVVTQAIFNDLMKKTIAVSNGEDTIPEMTANLHEPCKNGHRSHASKR
eukprot:GFYU01006684.1.p1 GENE.GFYU01006684.1~~GFYU01006684.1.p1  ORF type:complete len:614 (-),score=150.52 GFYU01006684.1:238-2079(-)